jgi:hypothetical protein
MLEGRVQGRICACYEKRTSLRKTNKGYEGGIWTTVKSVAPLAGKGEPDSGVSAPPAPIGQASASEPHVQVPLLLLGGSLQTVRSVVPQAVRAKASADTINSFAGV